MKQIAFILCSVITFSTANSATLTHEYLLNGSTADTFAGSPLVLPNPGGLGPTGYSFDEDEGPNLSNSVNPADYSIELIFSVESDDIEYQKVIDFKNRAVEEGYYIYDDYLYFYDESPDDNTYTFAADEMMSVVVTRNGGSDDFNAYLNGTHLWSFNDSSDLAVFDATNNIMHFLIDDDLGVYDEHPVGFLDSVRIWDGALTANEVAALGASVPEPATATLAMLGLGGLLMRRSCRG